MPTITVETDEETKMTDDTGINWSELVRNAIRNRIVEERKKSLEKAVLINERIRRKRAGEARAEEIIRRFRDGRYSQPSSH